MQSSLDGEALAYSADAAFADAEKRPQVHPVLGAARPAAGWLTRSTNPPRATNIAPGAKHATAPMSFDKVFSPDLCTAWLRPHRASRRSTPPRPPALEHLPPRAGERRLRGAGQRHPGNSELGHSGAPAGGLADGTHVVFIANGRLTENASTPPTRGSADLNQTYERYPGGLRLVSVLPGGAASRNVKSEARRGLLGVNRRRGLRGRGADLLDEAPVLRLGAGQLYARIGGAQTGRRLGVGLGAKPPSSRRPTRGGQRALFTIDDGVSPGDQLYYFDV